MENQKFEIVSTRSNIDWVGRKITGAHNGTIAVKEGELILNDGKLAGGKFIVDTTSIKIVDITDPTTNAQFAGHLASDDFFSIEKYPEAILEITQRATRAVEDMVRQYPDHWNWIHRRWKTRPPGEARFY